MRRGEEAGDDRGGNRGFPFVKSGRGAPEGPGPTLAGADARGNLVPLRSHGRIRC